MLVFVDESGCDKRHTMRRFGYALRGEVIIYLYVIVCKLTFSCMCKLCRSPSKRCSIIMQGKACVCNCHDDHQWSFRNSVHYWRCGWGSILWHCGAEAPSTLDAIQWDQPTERRNTGQLLYSPHKYSIGTDSEYWSFGSLPSTIFAWFNTNRRNVF